jgi:hypothetical protein
MGYNNFIVLMFCLFVAFTTALPIGLGYLLNATNSLTILELVHLGFGIIWIFLIGLVWLCTLHTEDDWEQEWKEVDEADQSSGVSNSAGT